MSTFSCSAFASDTARLRGMVYDVTDRWRASGKAQNLGDEDVALTRKEELYAFPIFVSFVVSIWRNLARDVSHFGSTRRTEAPHSKKSPNCPRLRTRGGRRAAACVSGFQLFGPDLRIKLASSLVETTQVSKQAITCRMTSVLGQIPPRQ